ncbi:ribonuclease T2 [Mesocricetibacter intestinalis]|uniref:Ribonuclease T2 n=1 Tax=Mesocricetibacter intestinalis TaxID=1521930 RepID=A0A4R6VA61_9PAST|nr:ribonuclease T [Mesocricetibacter intestinalis]TDQ56516.1 ribonuclease T2 [Mesocricetibacter intestinalis]
MNQKQIFQLSLFVVFVFMLILAGWFYSGQYKDKAQAASVSAQKEKAEEARAQAVRDKERGYDYIMAEDNLGQNKKAKVDYYMLALSWSPAFCETQRKRYGDNLPDSLQRQCGSENTFGWVIHGLWPQSKTARKAEDHPRFCQGDLPPVEHSLIEKYLAQSPSENLLQGQWEKHGACAFNSAEDYFSKQRELYGQLNLPTKTADRKNLFTWLKKNNPRLKGIYLKATRNELFICYDLRWKIISCPK